MKICPNCGSQNLDSASFCKVCGYKLEKPKALCPYCHKEIEPGEKFCRHCGASLTKKTTKNKNLKLLLYLLIGLVVAVAIGIAGYHFLNKYFAEKESPSATIEENPKQQLEPTAPDDGKSYIYDYANIIDPEYEDKIDILISNLREESSIEIYVVTTNSMSGKTEEDYISNILEEIGLEKNSDELLLFLISLEENICRIEAGKSLTDFVPKSSLEEILSNYAIPELNLGEFGSGTYNALSEVVRKFYEAKGDTDKEEEKLGEDSFLPQDVAIDYKYIIGDYSGYQIREDGEKFLKRISITENEDTLKIECFSEKKNEPELEEYPSGIVEIYKEDIRVNDNNIELNFQYEVDYRPMENKIGQFEMKIILDLDEPDLLKGTVYYSGYFLNGNYVNHTYDINLRRV